MKKNILINAIAILLLAITGTFAQDPILKKSAVSRSPYGTGATTNFTSVTGFVMDKEGNRYMSGRYKGTYDFDPGSGIVNYTSTNTGASAGFDLFITKLDKNDNLIWVKIIGTTGDNEFVRNMAVDANGNVIVTGIFREDMDFDPGAGTFTMSNGTTPSDFKSLFMLKLDANGDFLWAKNFQANTTGGLIVTVDDMNIDTQNNILLSGYFRGTLDFDPNSGSMIETSTFDIAYFLKISSSGNYVLHKKHSMSSLTSTTNLLGSNVFGRSGVTDASGNIYSLWTFKDNFGTPNQCTALSKFNSTGTLLWAYQSCQPTTSSPAYLKTVLDNLGNVFISADRSVVKINTSTGVAAWTKPIVGFNIGIDNNNNIIKTGTFSSAEDLDPGPVYYPITTLNSFGDALLSKMDNDGNFIYAKGLGASGNSNAAIIRQNITSYGDIQVWGYFDNSIDVDPSASTKLLTNTTGLSTPGFWATYSQTPCTGSATSSSVSVSACGSYRWPTKAVTYTASGIYKDTLTNAVGCDSIITLNLTINPLPSISLTNNNGTNLTCANPSTTVTASGASTYAWTGTGGFTASTAAATISAAGTYVVTGTSPLGCTATTSIVITEDKTPPTNISLGYSRTTIDCINPTAQIGANGSNATSFSWTGPSGFTATGNLVTISTGGQYTVVGMSTNGCTVTATSVNIVSNKTAPTVAITPTSAILTCTTQSTSITASGANTYSWISSNGGFANSNATVSITIAGTYSVTGTGTNGCTATANAVITENKVLPTITVTPTTAVLTCPNPTANLTASGGVSYSWIKVGGGFTATGATATVSTSGTYTVTGTGANGCTANQSVNITSNLTAPSFTIEPNVPVNLTCTNPYMYISAPPGSLTGATISWVGPSGFTATTGLISPTLTGTYTVTVTGTNGCTTTISRTVNSIDKTPPTITVTPTSGVITCANSFVSSTASGSNILTNTFSWTGPNGYASNGFASATFTAAGTYTVSGTSSSNGCVGTASVVITENKTPPVVTITPTTAVLTCANPSQTLTASGAASYAWTRSGGGFNASTPSINVTTPDTYFVTGTGANGCTSNQNRTVTQNIAVPSTGLTYSTTVLTCTNPSIPVTASGGDSYAWTGTGGFTATTATATISNVGTYVVTITGSNGCTATRSVVITENKTLPTVSVTPTTGNLTCTNSNVTLSSNSNGVTYNWSKVGGGFTATGVTSINVNTPGTYVITVSGSNGCTASASAIVNQNTTPPPVAINPASAALSCITPTTILTASGGNTYAWSGPVGFVSTSAAINIIYSGTYIVTATGTNNCTATASITVVDNQTPPVLSVTPTTTVLNCAVPSVTLTATGGNTYAWTGTGGFTATSAAVNITTGGMYIVTATNLYGCTASVSRVITANTTLISLSVTPTSAALNCTTPSTTLTASGGSTYAWTGTGGFTATSASINISTGGTYIVTATGTNACTASASVVILENKTLPTVSVTPTSVVLTCSNPSVTLVASGSSGVSYAWSLAGDVFTSTSASIIVTVGGTYTVTVTSPNGCTASASVTVTGGNTVPPVVTITPNPSNAVITCTNPFIVLNGNIHNAYSWSGPGGFTSTTGSVNPSVAGVYTLTGTAVNGCTATASITITQNTIIPTVAITPTTTVLTCLDPTLILTASGNGNSTYSWRSDTFVGAVVNPNLTISTAGSFSLQATADNGCRSSLILFTITDNKTPPPVTISSNIASNVLNCISPSRTLTASGGSTYAWTGVGGFTATTAAVTVSVAGTYVLTATGTNGCTGTTSITLTDNTAPPTISITPTSAVLTCLNPSSTLTAISGNSSSYSWTGPSGFTATTESITISNAGTYVVTGTRPNGCTASVSVIVTNNIVLPSAPTISPTGTVSLCLPTTSVVLTASGCTGGTITWNTSPTPSTGTTLNVTQAGSYSATCTTSCGTSPASVATVVTTVCVCSLNASLSSGNWSNASNWSCGHVPLATEPVQISTGHTIMLNVNGAAKSLDLRGILQKQAGFTLQVQGN
jgi:hypothetical protein